ncbi:hypothetical protein EHW66_02860 [Erwinia psidii]|nr:hypothetical protein [Erwinia psidii]MCX8960768.1 hypothetical protein [Erwinia psidii]MCX8963986.1 hypothetical protein [Erwinia psidii]
MRLAIIAPATVTGYHWICGVSMRQFYDNFMKKAPFTTQFTRQRPFTLGFLPGRFIIVNHALRTEGIPCE